MVGTAERLGVRRRAPPPDAGGGAARTRTRRSSGRGSGRRAGAGVQPARLARGLRRVLLERGVRIFEHTPVTRLSSGSPFLAQTPGGSVRAGRAIVGLNAWARHLAAFRRSLMVRGTYMVITEPAPERLAEIGWTGGEGLYDLRTALHYLRATPDGRIAFGGAGLRVTSTRRVDVRFAYDERSVRELVEDLHAWFPPFRDVPLDCGMGRTDRRLGSAPAVLRHAPRREHPLRPRLHRQRRRAVPPRRADPLGSRARRRRRCHDAPDRRRPAQAVPPGPALRPGRAARHPRGAPQGRPRGPRAVGRERSPAPSRDCPAVSATTWGHERDRRARCDHDRLR